MELRADDILLLLSALRDSSTTLPVRTLPGPAAVEVAAAVQHVAQELLGPHASADAPLMEAGLDSLGTIEFRSRLSSRLCDVHLPDTLVFDHPTLRQVEAHVSALITSQAGAVGHGEVQVRCHRS